jgi:hypothetical protein
MALTRAKAFTMPAAAGDSNVISIAEFSSTTYSVSGTGFQFQVFIDAGDGNFTSFMDPTDAPYAVVLQGPAQRAKITISTYVSGTPVGVVCGTRSMEGSAQAQ